MPTLAVSRSENPTLFFQDAIDRSFYGIMFTWDGIYIHLWKSMLFWLILWGVVEGCIHTIDVPNIEENGRWEANHWLIRLCDFFEESKLRMITMTVFLTGFYVNVTYNRWWNLYTAIPWPDDIAMALHTIFNKNEETEIKKTLMRYMLLAQALTFMWISPKFLEKYPNLQSLIDVGLLTYEERISLNRCYVKNVNDCTYWTPYLWFQNLIYNQYRKGAFTSEAILHKVLHEAKCFMGGLGSLFVISDVTVPLTYMQAIAWCVWALWGFTIFCAHSYDATNRNSPKYLPIPLFSFLINFILLGLLKVSLIMMYPLGSHACNESFDLLDYFERNLKVCQIMLDCPLTDEAKKLIDEAERITSGVKTEELNDSIDYSTYDERGFHKKQKKRTSAWTAGWFA